MFSTYLPRYSSFLPPESGIIFIVFTMRTYANFDKIQNYILLNFDKYDFTKKMTSINTEGGAAGYNRAEPLGMDSNG